MKKDLITLALLLISIFSFSQGKEVNPKPVFNADLAKELGADDYGMKQYVMAFLKEGENKSMDSATSANIQMAHLKNILRLADEGKLIVAGPFLDNQPLRGIFIFNCKKYRRSKRTYRHRPCYKSRGAPNGTQALVWFSIFN